MPNETTDKIPNPISEKRLRELKAGLAKQDFPVLSDFPSDCLPELGIRGVKFTLAELRELIRGYEEGQKAEAVRDWKRWAELTGILNGERP